MCLAAAALAAVATVLLRRGPGGAPVFAAALQQGTVFWDGIPVQGVRTRGATAGLGDAVDGIPVEGPAAAPATRTLAVANLVPPYHAWGTKPHGDYVADVVARPLQPAGAAAAFAPTVAAAPPTGPCSRGCNRPAGAVVRATRPVVVVRPPPHNWGTKPHGDYVGGTFLPYRPIRFVRHHWGTREHGDFADDVFGKGYRPPSSVAHHWGTREHKDFADDVFGKGYKPDISIGHHWGTRTHGDYAADVFRKYEPDPRWTSHWGTRGHADYADDVYGHKYEPDPVFAYHWGTRTHRDYADDVYAQPFVSWDMPYGVAAPAAGSFPQVGCTLNPTPYTPRTLHDEKKRGLDARRIATPLLLSFRQRAAALPHAGPALALPMVVACWPAACAAMDKSIPNGCVRVRAGCAAVGEGRGSGEQKRGNPAGDVVRVARRAGNWAWGHVQVLVAPRESAARCLGQWRQRCSYNPR